jgi:hypothetical protein
LVFTLTSGEREALITNLNEGEMEGEAFVELYYKRWPIETKYSQIKQKLELENFSGRLVDNIRQDFYAMMTVSNMLASCVREANGKIRKEQAQKENRYEYQANVNHAIEVLKDRLIEILIAEDLLTRKYLYGETGVRDKTADNSGAAKPGSTGKGIPEKTSFSSQSQIGGDPQSMIVLKRNHD